MATIALFAAVLVASAAPDQKTLQAVVGSYVYWISRIGAEALLFFVVRAAVEAYAGGRLSLLNITGLAILGSHLPFVLSVTAMDLVLGYPEIGIGAAGARGQTHITATLREVFYLADNHIALCALLSLPRWISMGLTRKDEPQTAITFLSTLDPPLVDPVLWIEAQEHYVRITTASEARLVLARFSDVVRELPENEGMQVHRSHWVRTSAVDRSERQGQNLYLHLSGGAKVPVSRSFRQKVLQTLEA